MTTHYEMRHCDRDSRFIPVSNRDYREYRSAVGQRKVQLHLRLFYDLAFSNTMRPCDPETMRRLEHPILVGALAVEYSEVQI